MRTAQNYVEGAFGHQTPKKLTSEHHLLLAVSVALPLVLGFWGTTQWFAYKFRYAPALGAPWSEKFYPPWRILVWLYQLSGEPLHELATAKGCLGITVVATFFISLMTLASCVRALKNRSDEVHDSGRYGREDELEAQGMLQDGYPSDGIVLGSYRPDLNAPTGAKNRMRRVVDNTDTPVVIVGPSGSGKGAVLGMPSMFAWKGSALVVDPKLEFYRKTAGYRSTELGQRVGIFDPLNSTRSLRYNFLDFIRHGTDFEIRDAMNTAIYFTDSSGKGLDDARMEHWVQTPAGLLAAGMLHVMYRAERENWGRPATLFDLAWELSGRDHPAVEAAIERAVARLVESKKPVPEDPSILVDTTAEVLRSWMTYEHADHGAWEIPNGTSRTLPFIAMRAQEQIDRMKTPEGSGHLSTVRKVLSLFEDPHIRRVTSRSDFKVEDLQACTVPSPDGPKTGLTLYWPIPLADFKRLRPMYRAFICQATSRLTEEEKPASERNRLLYFLDEFTTLGRLDILFNIFNVGRSYGIKAVIFFQTFGSLQEQWGQAAATALVDNAETLIAMAPGPGAIKTAETFSEMTGKITLRTESRSQSSKAFGGATTHNDSQREVVRPLLTKGEIMTLPRTIHKTDAQGRDVKRADGTVVIESYGVQLLFRKNMPVVRIAQTVYYADAKYLAKASIPPPPYSQVLPTPNAKEHSYSLQLKAPKRPPAGWPKLADGSFAPSNKGTAENASELLELVRDALDAHGVDAALGTPACGPRLITLEVLSETLTDADLKALVVQLELASILGRPVSVLPSPSSSRALIAVPKRDAAPLTLGDLPSIPAPNRFLPIGLNAYGDAVTLELLPGTLLVQGNSKFAVEAWVAVLTAHYTPDEIAVDLLLEGFETEAPHITNWKPDSYWEALKQLEQGDPRLRIALTEHAPPADAANAGVLWMVLQRHGGQQSDALATVRFDEDLPKGDAWITRNGLPTELVHTPWLREEDLSVLEALWARARARAPTPSMARRIPEPAEADPLDEEDLCDQLMAEQPNQGSDWSE